MNSPSLDAANSPNKKVLIVDSQEMVRSLLCRMLKSWGLDCHPAPDIFSACQAVLSEGPFDAVVCDYELPDGTAYNLIAHMRKHRMKTPAIVPVGALAPTVRPEAGVELLAKPFDPTELRGALERSLGVCLPKDAEPRQKKERAAVRA
jgi:DNA-binding NtrC family response regulator